jgi:hypothetical protein
MTGIYVRCDQCGNTLGGEQVSSAENGLHWSESSILKQEAIKLGWSGDLDRNSIDDKCPVCSISEGVRQAMFENNMYYLCLLYERRDAANIIFEIA